MGLMGMQKDTSCKVRSKKNRFLQKLLLHQINLIQIIVLVQILLHIIHQMMELQVNGKHILLSRDIGFLVLVIKMANMLPLRELLSKQGHFPHLQNHSQTIYMKFNVQLLFKNHT